jgi:hypothetical protein
MSLCRVSLCRVSRRHLTNSQLDLLGHCQLIFFNDEEKKSFDKIGTKNPEESCEKPKGV